MNHVAVMAIRGSIDKAAVLLEAFRASPESTESDHLQIDSTLADYYARLGGLRQAVAAIQRVLSSESFDQRYERPLDQARERSRWQLELAKNELLLADFEAADAAAANAISLIDATKGLDDAWRAQAERVRELAAKREAEAVEEPTQYVRHPAVAIVPAAPPLSPREVAQFRHACTEIEQHLNAGRLADLSASATNQAEKIDLFGDGTAVTVANSASIGMPSPDIKAYNTAGQEIPIALDPEEEWSVPYSEEDKLLKAAGRYVLWVTREGEPNHVIGFGQDRMARKICEFEPAKPLATILQSHGKALCEAARNGKLEYAPFQYHHGLSYDAVSSSKIDRIAGFFPSQQAAQLDIDNVGEKRKVVTLEASSRGCDISMVAVLDRAGTNIDTSLSEAILDQIEGCVTERPFTFAGQAYIEVLGTGIDGKSYQKVEQLKQARLDLVCDVAKTPQYVLASPIERLMNVASTSQPPQTLIRYAMTRPGLGAVETILETSRRRNDPTLLAPAPTPNNFHAETILVAAVDAGRLDVLRFLLEKGVDANLANHEDTDNPQIRPATPLSTALKYDDLDALRLLLDHGADPSVMGGYLPLLRQAFEGHHSTKVFKLLLDSGADPDTVPADLTALVQRKPVAIDSPEKIDLLLRHGADAGWWAHTLYNAIAGRSDLALARQLAARDPDRLPQMVKYVPIKSIWVDNLLRNPTRAPDNGLEPMLQEAVAIRDAPDCSESARGRALEDCLPATLHRAVAALNTAEEAVDSASRLEWRRARDGRCALRTNAAVDSAGWISYVLADPERARCVIEINQKRSASLRAKP